MRTEGSTPATPDGSAPVAVSRGGPLAQALRALRPHLLAAGAISLVANLLMLTPTLYMLQLYERVLMSQNLLSLLAVSLVAAVSLLAMAWADRRRNRRLILASVQLDNRLAPQVMASAHRAVVKGDEQARSGTPPMADLGRLRQFITGPASVALFDVPWTPVYVAVLWLLHPWLGLAALGFVALQGLLALYGHWRSQTMALPAHQAEQAAQGYLQHKFRHAEAVEGMGMSRGLWRRWGVHHAQQMQAAGAAQAVNNRLQAGSRFLRYAQQSAALGLGGWLVVRGELGVGAMIAANVLTTRALAPVDALAAGWASLHGAVDAARRLDRLLTQFVPVPPAQTALDFAGQVGLEAAEVRLPGNGRPVLHDIRLDLQPGTVTVLMGPSGAGKSTLARVLVGAWPGADEGLTHDGRRLSESERAALGARRGYLPQEIELADATVSENIARLGKPNPEAVIQAARRCGLHEAILRLPRGYDTPVGAGGHPLSGGLRQRLALARAVYGAPRLLVLDEPNAHLDDAGEADLATLLRDHREQGGTALVVSHRRGVLAVADRVLVMEAGRIVTDGPRDCVLAVRQAAQQAERAADAPCSAPALPQPAAPPPEAAPPPGLSAA